MGSGGGFARQADALIDEGVSGEWYGSGGGPLDVPPGDALRFLLLNPLGSGRKILIHRFRIHVTTASEYVQILVNPTTDLPVSVIPAYNRYVGKPNGQADLFLDTGVAMTGGLVLPYNIPVETAGATFTEFIIMPTIVLPPGSSIGTNFVNTTAGVSKGTALVDWKEIAA